MRHLPYILLCLFVIAVITSDIARWAVIGAALVAVAMAVGFALVLVIAEGCDWVRRQL